MLQSGALCALLVLSAACGPGQRSATEAIEPFLSAVQEENLDALACRMAGAAGTPRSDFAAWAAARLEAYREGRDAGRVDVGEDGIVAVKLLGLGRGTYFELHDARRVGSNGLRVRMDLRLGYQAMDLSGFSPGTTFYLCGVPVGRVYAIRKPAGQGEESVEVLDRISLEWTLVHEQEDGRGCPARWAVATVAPIEGTATSRSVTWVF